jgi:voltage-gated potassium channel
MVNLRFLWISLVSILVTGTVGFRVLEEYPWLDAFYMTLTTVTTVGYGEIHPLSQRGRFFNSILILFGVGIMFQAVGVLARAVVEREFAELFGIRKKKRMIEKLRDHYIICGFGRVGRGAALAMQREGVSFVVADRNEERVDRAMRMGMLAVVADCTRDETLKELQIDKARGLVAALASDADNMFLVLSAKTLNPMLNVSARAGEEEAEQKLRRAGADMVFAPYYLTGTRMAQSLIKPHVQEFMDVFTGNLGLNAAMEQVAVAEHSEVAGKSLRDLQLRRDVGVIVLAIRRGPQTMEFNPSADAVLKAGDSLVVMGEPAGLRKLERMLGGVRA